MSNTVGLSSRQTEIINRLGKHGFVSTAELAASLAVSDMTIRRDTRDLATRGIVKVVHGGVSLPHGALHTTDFAERASNESDGKERIAIACQALISPRETIIIDAGTTCFEVAHQLPNDFQGTIITNSAPVIQQGLQFKSARTICLGGELLQDSQAFAGDMTVAAVTRLRAQKTFLGVAALHADGLYVDRDLELPVKRALIRAADHVVVVATSGKMNHPAIVHLMDFDAVDTLVTEAPLPPAIAKALAGANVRVITADQAA
ncbi:DeoR/GlpR family DNA-binding transcription regulator [Arthrobacter bambusae]|uniref:DeoR/GlpR family DNA-binding transcription regulator n=1 Tax=Arthrobacter bambusae TaxID=1338426 RepID=UPI0027832E6C|nr:DeoR/GlpR family DNA-binding transcription regulator [Arthrobacter bambusae]MDQ0213481.1 DeoR/GlpR family transcriptional regulator of sugar metabolism [Arthrobacter bambusae]MDQ0237808.1 DeoR/GlpR family transcriptional regulator of sugar metabolism [Arthrobacter bambusae]